LKPINTKKTFEQYFQKNNRIRWIQFDMKELEFNLKKDNSSLEEVSKYRIRAVKKNINSFFAEDIIGKFVSPDSFEGYILYNGEQLICNTGKNIPINNGIPDFTIFSQVALDEKEKQAKYHDDEEINEKFIEIVLRPYNYNKLHANIWLKPLYDLCRQVEKISNRSFENFTILNCGCGGGFEAQFFAEQGAKVVGFDISQLRAEAASTRFALKDLAGFFYRGDAAILPFPNNTFDLVIYHDSLHHVPIEEIPLAIKEARRVAKKYIILSEAHDSPIRMILESFGKSISIEASGNYTFRFRKSLMQFWCQRFGMKLLLYKTTLTKKEHRSKIYSIPILGVLIYSVISIFGFFLSAFGNEALIIMEKEDKS